MILIESQCPIPPIQINYMSEEGIKVSARPIFVLTCLFRNSFSSWSCWISNDFSNFFCSKACSSAKRCSSKLTFRLVVIVLDFATSEAACKLQFLHTQSWWAISELTSAHFKWYQSSHLSHCTISSLSTKWQFLQLKVFVSLVCGVRNILKNVNR